MIENYNGFNNPANYCSFKAVVNGPGQINSQIRYSDEEAGKHFRQINKEINDDAQKNKNADKKKFFTVFGIFSVIVLAISQIRKI